MSNIINIAGIEVRQDAEGRYSLNDLHRAAGEEVRHRPGIWLQNDQTKALVAEIEIDGIPSILAKQGLGTFACKELVYAYAMWINAAFHLKVIRTFDAVATGQNLNPANLSRLQLIQIAMEAEQEKLALEAVVAEQAPKVEAHDRIADSTGTLCLRDAAKALQMQPIKLNQWLQANNWIYRRLGKGAWTAYQDRIQSGQLTHKLTPYFDEQTGDNKVSEQVRVTGKGLTLIAKRLNVELGPADVPAGILVAPPIGISAARA